MNCCDYDCNQGRDCPARVAKVKRRIPKHPAPLRDGQYLRRNLRHLAKWMLLAIAVMFGTSLVGALVVGGNLLAGVLA